MWCHVKGEAVQLPQQCQSAVPYITALPKAVVALRACKQNTAVPASEQLLLLRKVAHKTWTH